MYENGKFIHMNNTLNNLKEYAAMIETEVM